MSNFFAKADLYFFDLQTFAKKKGGGSSKNGRDSNANYLGIKKSDGSFVVPGQLIYLQRGTKIHPGLNVRRARNDTLYAVATGYVSFKYVSKTKKIVSVLEKPKDLK